MQLWDQMSRESADAYRAFRTWLELPGHTRTTPAAIKVLGMVPTKSKCVTFLRWKKRFSWEARASAREQHFSLMTDEHVLQTRMFIMGKAMDLAQRAIEGEGDLTKKAMAALQVARLQSVIARNLSVVPSAAKTDEADTKVREFLGTQDES